MKTASLTWRLSAVVAIGAAWASTASAHVSGEAAHDVTHAAPALAVLTAAAVVVALARRGVR